MHKKLIIISTISLALLLSGCSFDKIPAMTDEQQAAVSEYAANLLLSHDKYRKSSILSEESIEEEKRLLEEEAALKAQVQAMKEAQEQAKAEKEESKQEASDEQASSDIPRYVDIDEFLGLSGLSIEYNGYEICQSYPSSEGTNDWQGVCRATGNNQLVVFKFNITNETGADYDLNMASMDTRFTFKIGASKTKSALTTLLMDDFIMYRGNIPAGETITNVMIIELSPDDASNISGTVMKMKYNGAIAETTLD